MWRAICRVVALAATALLIVACGASTNVKPKAPKKNVKEPTFNIVFERNYGGPERELIMGAFKMWERVSHGAVKFTVAKYVFDPELEEIPEHEDTCTYDVYVLRVKSTDPVVRKLDKRDNAKVLGFTVSSCEQRVIALVTDRLKDSKMFSQVMVHEAGHLVGLDHIPVPSESIMFPSMDKAAKCGPTALDMKQFCMLYECEWRNTTTCED